MKGATRQLTVQLAIAILIVFFLNLLGGRFFTRFDLTEEGRYSLTDLSRETMDSLDYPVFIRVYMEGDLPTDFKRLQDGIRTTLMELKVYSNDNLDFEFVDPNQNPELANQFMQAGISPMPVQVRVSATETKQVYIFPIGIVKYKDEEEIIDFVKGAYLAYERRIDFDKAEQDLEYKIVSAIRRLKQENKKLLGVLRGHGEISEVLMSDLFNDLDDFYHIVPIETKNGEAISPSVNVLMVLQPDSALSERDKYEIDQYIMRGGNVLWALDYQVVNMDLYERRSTMTQFRELNLDDMFLRYGFKINYDLIQDVSCEQIKVVQQTQYGPQFSSRPWLFHPVVYQFPEHPVTRNVDAVLLRNVSTIDTIHQDGVKKTLILESSDMSRTVEGQQFIDVDKMVSDPPPKQLFNKPHRIMGMLLEGNFQSVFTGREQPTDALAPQKPSATFLPASGLPGKQMVISDGDLFEGESHNGKVGRLPFDNKSFLINLIEYLSGERSLTEIRSKDIQARRLDVDKVVGSETMIQILNIGGPVLLVLAFGIIRATLRRRRNLVLQSHE